MFFDLEVTGADLLGREPYRMLYGECMRGAVYGKEIKWGAVELDVGEAESWTIKAVAERDGEGAPNLS